MPVVELFFDYACPYCYRGHQALMPLLQRFPEVSLRFVPVEAHPRCEEPGRSAYSDLAVQGTYYVRAQGGDELAYHERLYRARFEEGLALDDANVLAGCVAGIGLEPEGLLAALKAGTYQREQLAANAYAFGEKQVWAVPTLVCGAHRLDAKENVGVTLQQLEAFLASL